MASDADVTPMLDDSDLVSEGQVTDDSEIPKSNNPTALPKRGRAAIGQDKAIKYSTVRYCTEDSGEVFTR